MEKGFSFDIETPDLRRILDHIASFDPKLATDLRRELRRSGDDVIAAQRAILAGPKPGRVTTTGKRLVTVRPRNGRKPYKAWRVTLATGSDTGPGRQRLRSRISAGLRTQVSTGTRVQGVSIKTTGPRDRSASGTSYNLARLWEARMFRHPVFASAGGGLHKGAWVYQAGRPYFWDPIDKQFVTVRQRIFNSISDALDRLAQQG